MRRAGLAALALAVLLPPLLYLGILESAFVYDDYRTVVGNAAVETPTDLAAVFAANRFRPVLALTYALDAIAWGKDPLGFHVTNVVLHLLNVALLFLLARTAVIDWRRRDGDDGDAARTAPDLLAGLAALLFAVHPMMTQAVTYVSGRSELLCAAWVMLGVLALRQAVVGGRPWWVGLALLAFVLGLATKELAAMLPAVALLYDRLLLGGTPEARRRRLLYVHGPLLAVAAIAVVVRSAIYVFVQAPPAQTTRPEPWHYFLTQLQVVWRYVFLLLAPVGQSIFHAVYAVRNPLDIWTAAGATGILLACALALTVSARAPLVTFGVAWFFLLLIPSSSVVPLQEFMSEHRVYGASIGFFIAVAAGVAWLLARRPLAGRTARLAAAAAALMIVATLSGLTVLRNRVWATPVALWRDAVKKNPTMWTYFHLGNAHRENGDCQRAAAAYRNAVRLRPELLAPYPDLAACLIELGRLEEARQALTAGLRIDPSIEALQETMALLERIEARHARIRSGNQ